MRTLGIRSQNVYRLEKKGGSAIYTGRQRSNLALEEQDDEEGWDPEDLSEFHEICRQASGRHTKWKKINFLR